MKRATRAATRLCTRLCTLLLVGCGSLPASSEDSIANHHHAAMLVERQDALRIVHEQTFVIHEREASGFAFDPNALETSMTSQQIVRVPFDAIADHRYAVEVTLADCNVVVALQTAGENMSYSRRSGYLDRIIQPTRSQAYSVFIAAAEGSATHGAIRISELPAVTGSERAERFRGDIDAARAEYVTHPLCSLGSCPQSDLDGDAWIEWADGSDVIVWMPNAEGIVTMLGTRFGSVSSNADETAARSLHRLLADVGHDAPPVTSPLHPLAPQELRVLVRTFGQLKTTTVSLNTPLASRPRWTSPALILLRTLAASTPETSVVLPSFSGASP